MIVDTHIHLDDDRYDSDFDDMLFRGKNAGVLKYIIPGASLDTLSKAVGLAEKYEEIYFAVGVHPYDAPNYDRRVLERYITHDKCVAVGECGLDYFRLPDDDGEKKLEKILQREVFIDQIMLAQEHNKPLIVHIRDASRDSQEILERYASDLSGVLHCYNADHELLSLADRGFYFGIGGVLTFKNAKKLVDIYPKIPMDKLLIETDGPYLTPHPFRGERNEPSHCLLVAKKMAQLSQISTEEITELTSNNCKTLFGI